jgi:hypothetical protein
LDAAPPGPVGLDAAVAWIIWGARAQVVQGAGDELLAGTRFAADEYGRSGRGDGLDLLEHPSQGSAVADDLPEIVLRADFLFQVEVLLGQPVFQLTDLAVGLRVLHRNRDLLGHLAEQFDLIRGESVFALPADVHGAQHPFV